MSQFVYGVFESRNNAEQAIERVDALHHGSGVEAFVHEGHLEDGEIQMSGTQGLRGMIAGGVVSGLFGALIAAFVLAPAHDMGFGLAEFMLVALAGGVFGVCAGGVAGASEAKQEVAALGNQLRAGKVVVTMQVPTPEAGTVTRLLTESGASMARTA